MRVLVIGRSYPEARTGMMGLFEMAQARALSSAGVEVIYAFVDRRPAHVVKRFGGRNFVDPDSGIPVRGWYLPVKGLPRNLVQSLRTRVYRKIVRAIESEFADLDAIYAHFPTVTLPPQFVQEVSHRGIPLAVMEHWSRVLERTLPHRFHRALQTVIRNADAFGCVSEDLAQSVRHYARSEMRGDMYVIPNIVADYTTQESVASTDVTATTFIAIGRMVKSKGFEDIVDAFSQLEDADARLVMVGDGPERGALENMVRKRGLQDAVTFTGMIAQREVARNLMRANCYVSASRLETFGVPIVEAWFAGIRAIAPDTNPIRDSFTAENGILYSTTAVTGLRDAMRAFLTDDVPYSASGIREQAQNQFGEEGVTQRVREMIVAAIERRTGRAQTRGNY